MNGIDKEYTYTLKNPINRSFLYTHVYTKFLKEIVKSYF